MKYLKTYQATDWKEKKSKVEKVISALLFFIPKANPDYESKMHLIKEWLIEFDVEDRPLREIALDDHGEVLFKGPNENNYGYWLDTNLSFKYFEGIDLLKEEFETLWNKE